MWVIGSEMTVLNAFYAKKEGILKKKDIWKFQNILLNKLSDSNIMYIVRPENEYWGSLIEYEGIRLIQCSDVIFLQDIITEEKINEINSWWGEKISRIIEESREEYAKLDLDKPRTRNMEESK